MPECRPGQDPPDTDLDLLQLQQLYRNLTNRGHFVGPVQYPGQHGQNSSYEDEDDENP